MAHPAQALQIPRPAALTPVPEFICAEIWGGNRPVDAPIDLPGLRGWLFSHPCDGGRGGDIHYISICSSALISRMCIADVAGHGAAISRVSEEIHRLLRRYMNNFDERRVLRDLNERLAAGGNGTMTTAVTASYFPPLRSLTLSYAGHPPAWFYTRSLDAWTRLPPWSAEHHDRHLLDLPLAVDIHTLYTRRKVRVHYGDRLLIVTDGVLEAPDPAGRLYGDARLEQLLADERHTEVGSLATRIVKSVVAHTRDPNLPHDDVTLLLLEITRGPRAFGVWHMMKNRLLGRRPRTHRQ